jgi:hypothetical protein
MEDLDQILLEQLHAAKNGHKLIKRLKKLIRKDKGLDALERQNKIRIEFFENMIENKELLRQKSKKKKKKDSDLLSRNPFYEAYRYTVLASVYGYTVMSSAMKDYWSFFRKTKDEKDNS